MSTFQDSAGRPWTIAINYKTCKLVHEQVGTNLLDLRTIDDTLAKLRFDNLLIADIVTTLCAAEVKARELTIDAFTSTLDGESLSEASDAILEGLGNFFQRSRTGKLLNTLIEKMRKLETEAINQAIAAVSSETTSGPSGDSATVSQASSA